MLNVIISYIGYFGTQHFMGTLTLKEFIIGSITFWLAVVVTKLNSN